MKGSFSARKSVVVFASGWTSYFLNVLSTLLVAHSMGPSALGRIGYAAGIVGLLVMFTNLGFTFAHTKRIAEGFDPALAIGTCSVLLGVLHLLTLPFFIVMVVKANALFDSPTDAKLFMILFGAQILTNFATVAISTLYAFGLASRVFLGQIAGKCVRLAVILVIVAAHQSLVWVALAFFIDSAITCAALWSSILPYGFRWPTRASYTSYWRYAKPMVGISSVGMLVDSIDRVLLKDMVGVERLGYYNAARSVLEVAKSVPSAAVSILFPKWTKDFTQQPSHELASRFEESLHKLLLISGAVSLVIGLAAPDIVNVLFGTAFDETIPLVRILAWGTLAASLLGTFHYVLYASESHHIILFSGFFTAVVYIISLLALTTYADISGAAAAFYLTWLVPAYWINRRARQVLKISLRKQHLHYVLASLLGFFIAWPIHRSESWVTLFPSLIVGLAIYGGWMVYCGLLTGQQVRYWIDLLNIRKLWHEASVEFKRKGPPGH